MPRILRFRVIGQKEEKKIEIIISQLGTAS